MLKLAVVAAVLYVALVIIMYALHEKLILPGRHDANGITPAAAGLTFEDLTIPVDGSSYLHAWWLPALTPSNVVILYFHGNYEVLGTEATIEAPLLHATNANVLLVEYRGYGTSSPLQATGATTEADARAALRYLSAQRHVRKSNIILAGRSIGSAVATRLAVESPGAAGLVLVTPITSVADVANQNWVFRYLLRPVEWLVRDNFDTEARISAVRMPVLIVAGSRDVLAPPRMAQRIFGRANEPKSLHVIDGADHNDILERHGDAVLHVLRAFPPLSIAAGT
jgi:pimeloyl-ACP methyl ester carboxylesterase